MQQVETLKKALSDNSQTILAPGVYDAFTALLAEQAGFKTVYLSGASIAYTLLGTSDLGLSTYTEVEQVLRLITDRTGLNVIVDADTGFGNELNTVRTVRGFEKAGASMIQLEDQDYPKRCGHLQGKSVIPVTAMCAKLRAALDARRSDDTLILARTDSLAVEGFEAALDRAEAYLEQGVDALFIEAVRDEQQMQVVIQRFGHRIPLLANMVEGGLTPILPAHKLAEIGYKIVIFPGGAARMMAHSLKRYYSVLQAEQTTEPLRQDMLTFDQLNEVLGTQDLLAQAQKYQTPSN